MIRSSSVARIVAAFVCVVGLAACEPLIPLPGLPGPTCPQGTFHLTKAVIDGLVPTQLGDISVSARDGGTLTLTTTSDSWTFAGSQTLDVSGTTPFGPAAGAVSVTVDARGSYTKTSATRLTFALTSLSGSATFNGTVNGLPITRSASIDGSGFDDLYDLTGAVTYACGTSPALTLTINKVRLTF